MGIGIDVSVLCNASDNEMYLNRFLPMISPFNNLLIQTEREINIYPHLVRCLVMIYFYQNVFLSIRI